ncbi:hypothetical protein DL98DRAFT_231594 [Cadophora sp. DSE1049]|nr:hypothetical protein DL98DRAFT_231594 [Cadophora sp. DSE1049]
MMSKGSCMTKSLKTTLQTAFEYQLESVMLQSSCYHTRARKPGRVIMFSSCASCRMLFVAEFVLRFNGASFFHYLTCFAFLMVELSSLARQGTLGRNYCSCVISINLSLIAKQVALHSSSAPLILYRHSATILFNKLGSHHTGQKFLDDVPDSSRCSGMTSD